MKQRKRVRLHAARKAQSRAHRIVYLGWDLGKVHYDFMQTMQQDMAEGFAVPSHLLRQCNKPTQAA